MPNPGLKSGGMAERTKATVLKTVEPLTGFPGFESQSLRGILRYAGVPGPVRSRFFDPLRGPGGVRFEWLLPVNFAGRGCGD